MGTVTDRWLLYATQPTLEPFTAAAAYCYAAENNKAYTGQFQVSVISSYGGVRIWRLAPYDQCPVNPATGQMLCNEQQSAGSVQLQALNQSETDFSVCTQEFIVFASAMDYINEWNVAVTVLKTTLANVDTATLQPRNASAARYVTIFLNPDTLQFQEGQLFAPEAPSPALVTGTLCPSQRRTPNLGSIAAESMAALVLLIELPLNVVVGLPVALPLLGNSCPILNRGHTLLRTCGADLVSLDDYFAALMRYRSRAGTPCRSCPSTRECAPCVPQCAAPRSARRRGGRTCSRTRCVRRASTAPWQRAAASRS